MKPKAANEHEEGLLEYLEDIIGTSKYKTPIEEALVEVDGLNEVMGEKKGRLGIVVRELNGLKVCPLVASVSADWLSILLRQLE
jgi:structural maintenance of chromosome 4